MRLKPMGSRLLVKMLSNEYVTGGGILVVPGLEIASDSGGGAAGPEGPKGPVLQLVEILDVGEGKLNPTTNTFNGSRFQVGQRALMRIGMSAQVHIDFVPGKHNEALVQEDTIASLVLTGEEARAVA